MRGGLRRVVLLTPLNANLVRLQECQWARIGVEGQVNEITWPAQFRWGRDLLLLWQDGIAVELVLIAGSI